MLISDLFESTGDYDLQGRYDEFNRLYFGGELPRIPVSFKPLKTVGGKVEFAVSGQRNDPRAVRFGAPKYKNASLVPGSMKLVISSAYLRVKEDIDAILLHEMIHVWEAAVAHVYGENHARTFLDKRKELIAASGIAIPLTDSTKGLELVNAAVQAVGVILKPISGGRFAYMMMTVAATKRALPDIQALYDGAILVYTIDTPIWLKKSQELPLQRSFTKERRVLNSDGTIGKAKGYNYNLKWWYADEEAVADLKANGKLLLKKDNPVTEGQVVASISSRGPYTKKHTQDLSYISPAFRNAFIQSGIPLIKDGDDLILPTEWASGIVGIDNARKHKIRVAPENTMHFRDVVRPADVERNNAALKERIKYLRQEIEAYKNDPRNSQLSSHGYSMMCRELEQLQAEAGLTENDAKATAERMIKQYDGLSYSPHDRATDHAFSYDRSDPRHQYWLDVCNHIKTLLKEAPISDVRHVGAWGDKDRNSSFYDKKDRVLVSHPGHIERMKQKWAKTTQDFNMIFVNNPEGRKYQEMGRVTWAWLEENMPRTVADPMFKIDLDAINIVFTNNSGSERVPMTPWIMAHRFGHAIRREFGKNLNKREATQGSAMWDFEEAIEEFDTLVNLILPCYGAPTFNRNGSFFGQNRVQERFTIRRKFLQTIGTFRTAREDNLREYFEFDYELFAQYLMTGTIKFKPLPRYFKYGHTVYGWKMPESDFEIYNNDLETVAEGMCYRFADALSRSVGKIYVM